MRVARTEQPGAKRKTIGLVGLLMLLGGLAQPARAGGLGVSPEVLVVTPDEGATARLEFELLDPAGRPVTGVEFVADATIGRVSPVREVEPGRYVAEHRVPPQDAPGTVLVVLTPQDRPELDFRFASIPLRVRTELAARTEPGARVRVQVGPRVYGPVVAHRTGRWSVLLELRAGDREAEIRLEDSAGNVRRSRLRLPERRHRSFLVGLGSHRLTTDGQGRARVFALGLDQQGRPVRRAKIRADASTGSLSSFVDNGDGVHTASYAAPADGSEGVAKLKFRLRRRGLSGEDIARVALVRGEPSELVLSASPTQLVAGGGERVRLVAEVRDAAGQVLPGLPVRLAVDRGSLSEPVVQDDGRVTAILTPPERVESGSIQVTALVAEGVPDRLPARIALEVDPAEVPAAWSAFTLVTATVTDEQGRPVEGEIVRFRLAGGEGTVGPIAVTNAMGRAFVDFSASPRVESVTVEATATSVAPLTASVMIEKKGEGAFVTIERPSVAAQGGRPASSVVLEDGARVLRDTVLISLAAGSPATLTATVDPETLPADGRATARILAQLADAAGNGIREAVLTVSADRGEVTDVSPSGDGAYVARLTAPLGAEPEALTVTVQHPESGLTVTVPVALTPGPPARLVLTSDVDRLPADGFSTARLVATVVDAGGVPVPGARVELRSSGVEVSLGTPLTTDDLGEAEGLLTAEFEAGRVEIHAASGEAEASLALQLLPIGPVSLVATARPDRLPADGLSQAEITVELEDALGAPMVGEIVDFVLSGNATLTRREASTDALGVARVRLSSSVPGRASVLARSRAVPSLSEEVEVIFEAAELEVDFTVQGPACDGAVMLAALAPDALTFGWDWTGDGLTDATGPRVSAPLAAGSHEVTLTATDSAGLSAAVTRSVVVRALPTAVATATPELTPSDSVVVLDASESVSADGSALTYEWDWDDDPSPEATGPVADWRMLDGGHVARLLVTDGAGCSATTEVSAVWGEVPDLAVQVSAVGAPSQVEVGAQVDFRIDWSNGGLHPASRVTVESRLDPLLEVARIPAGGVVLTDGHLRFDLGDLPVGAAGFFILETRVATDLPNTTAVLLHEVEISSAEPDANQADNVDSVGVLAFEDVDLAVTLSSSSPSELGTGEALRLTAHVELLGTIDLAATTLELSWDPALLVGLVTDRPATVTDGAAVLELGPLNAGTSLDLPLSWTVAPTLPLPEQQASVAVRVSHASRDPNPANDVDSLAVLLRARPDLGVTITASPSREPLRPGDTVLYELDWTNAGDTAATSVTLASRFTPELVAGLLENPDGGILQGDALLFDLGVVEPRRSGRTTYRVELAPLAPVATDRFENESEIASAEAALDPPDDNVDTNRLAVEAPPDVWVSLTAPSAASAGDLVTWTLTVGNSGTRPATQTWVEHRVQGAALLHSGSSLQADVTLAADGFSIRAELGQLAPDDSVTWTHSALALTPQAAVNPSVSSFAEAGLAEPDDSDLTNNFATASPFVLRALPDLGLSLTLSDASPAPGETLEAVVTVFSVGEAPSPGGRVVLSWAGTVLSTASPVELLVPPLAVGDSVELAPVTLTVLPVLPATLNASVVEARVTGDAGDLDPNNDFATADLTVSALPDLVISATVAPGPFAPGESVEILVDWTNTGTTAATDVLVTLETLDADLLAAPAPLSISLSAVAVGESGSQIFTTTVASTLPERSLVATLRARGSAAEADADPASDSDLVELALEGTIDLELSSLVLSSFPDPPEPGATVEYAITVRNLGNAPSVGAELRFDRDAQLLVPSASLPQGATDLSGRISWPLPVLAPDQVYQRVLRFLLPESFAEETTTIAATSTVAAPFDGVPANDVADHSFTVGARVDLGVLLILEPATDPLWAGGVVRAIAHVNNAGTKTATDVELVVNLPALLVQQVLSASPGANIGPSWVRWTLPEVIAGETNLVRGLAFRLAPALPSTTTELVVEATVSADPVLNPELPATLPDNTSSASTQARAAADVCVRLRALPDPSPPAVGGRLDYEIVVENAGTTKAAPVTIVLEIDDGFLLIDDSAGATAGPGTLTWELTELAVDQIVTRVVRTHAPGAFPGLWYGALARAEATAAQDDGGGCSVQTPLVETLFSTVSDLRVEKQLLGISESPPRRGTLYDYRLIVENVGTAASPGGTLVDRYPSALLVQDAAGGFDDGVSLSWFLPGPIARGDSFTIDYSLVVDPALPAGLHLLRNEARVRNDGVDATTANDVFVHEVELQLDVDLVVELSGVSRQEPPVAGSIIDYEATVTNVGAETALGATLALDLGALAQLAGPSPGVGSAPIIVDLGDVLPGGVRNLSFSARSPDALPEPVNAITVIATAASLGGDGNPADNVASVTHDVRASLDLRAVLSAVDRDGASLDAGDFVDYTLRITNAGSLIATGVTARVDHDLLGLILADAGDFVPAGAGRLDATLVGGVAVTDLPRDLQFALQVAGELPATLNLLRTCGFVASDRPDTFPGDDSSCIDLTAVACPGLQVAFTLEAPTVPAAPGQTVDARVTVTNTGSTVATGVVLTVTRDLVLTTGLIASNPPGTETGGLITIPLADLAVGAFATADLSFSLAGQMPAVDSLLSSSACIAAAQDVCDPDAACTEASLAVRAPTDAWVVLSVSPRSPILQPGADLTYDIDFGNDGSAPLTGVVVTVELPDDVDVLDTGGGTLSGRTIEFRGAPELAPGQVDARTVLVRIRPALASESQVLRQVARIAHDRPDAELDTSNDVSIVEREVRASADLVATLERTSAAPLPDGSVSYRATWINNGTTTARSVTLTVEDDPDLLLVTGQPPASFGRVFDLGDVPVGAEGAQSLQYRVRRILPAANNSLTVAVTLASLTTESRPGDNRAAVTDTIDASADLAVTLDLAPADAANPCDELTATVGWTNAGSTAAVGVSIVFRLDPALVQVLDLGGGALGAGGDTITWTLPSLDAGTSGSASVRLRLACLMPGPTTTVPFDAAISSGTREANPADDFTSASLMVEACADLVVNLERVSASSDPLGPTGTVRHRLTVTNQGQTRATGVVASLHWAAPALVAEIVDAGGGLPDGTGGLTWNLGTLQVGGAAVQREVELRAADLFASYSNDLLLTASGSSLDCDLDPASNAAQAVTTIVAPIDLKLSVSLTNLTSGIFPAAPLDRVRLDTTVLNAGASPAEDVVLVTAYDVNLLQWSGGGSPLPLGSVQHGRGATNPLAPAATWTTSTTFTVRDLASPPTLRLIALTSTVDEAAFGTDRDASPADNTTGSSFSACYTRATIVQPYAGQLCQGSSVTLRAESEDPAGAFYQWSADAGMFDDPLAQVVVYTPPPAGGDYLVRLTVTSPGSNCAARAEHLVHVDGDCQSCGCQSAKMNMSYDGLIERVDRPGDRTAEQGERVAFRVRVKETANARSGVLLGGPGNTTMVFGPSGGPLYTAYLPHDIAIDCQGGGLLEFAAADVPADIALGEYTASFVFKTHDACDVIDSRSSDSGGDRIQILPGTNSAPDPGVEFIDWGPARRQP